MSERHPITKQHDLIVRAGTIACPVRGRMSGGLAIDGGRITAVGMNLDDSGRRVLDFPDGILIPGLIDIHAHPARSGSIFGIDPDEHMLARGTTTVLSQGDAGADGLDSFLEETILRSKTRVRLAINISAAGEAGPGGSCESLERLDIAKCVAAANSGRSHVWGIAVNASRNACGRADPREVVHRALQAARETGLPMLYGLRCPEDWPLAEQLQLLRPGDIVTYCYRRTPHCLIENGRVLPEFRNARSRGILFDVGHGRTSFDFTVAEAAIADGFLPDTISTDLQRGHVGESPIHDLPLVMSKLQAAGMGEADVLTAVTSRPAEILGIESEIGSLSVDACADLAVLQWRDCPERLFDTSGNTRIAAGRWQHVATIRSGELFEATSGTYA